VCACAKIGGGSNFSLAIICISTGTFSGENSNRQERKSGWNGKEMKKTREIRPWKNSNRKDEKRIEREGNEKIHCRLPTALYTQCANTALATAADY
jgi:hypothetical protein